MDLRSDESTEFSRGKILENPGMVWVGGTLNLIQSGTPFHRSGCSRVENIKKEEKNSWFNPSLVRPSFNISRCVNFCSCWGTEWPLALKSRRNLEQLVGDAKPQRLLPPVPFFFWACFSPVFNSTCFFFPFWSLITCTAWAGLCLYSWIHPFQSLFLDPRPSECHNSAKKSSKHGFSTGRNSLWLFFFLLFIYFLKSHKDCIGSFIFPFNYNFTSRPFKWVFDFPWALGVFLLV